MAKHILTKEEVNESSIFEHAAVEASEWFILPSRAGSPLAHTVSCALALLLAHSRWQAKS